MTALIIFLVWLVVFIILTTVYRITDYTESDNALFFAAFWPISTPFILADIISNLVIRLWKKCKGGDGWD